MGRIGWLQKVRAKVERTLSPGYSYCYRCKRPWSVVKGHNTKYAEGRSCFPLCEGCWQELTPLTRLPHYRMLREEWEAYQEGDASWEDMKKAVLAGL